MMALPIIVRVVESGVRAVPADLQAAAQGLGLSRWTTLRRLILPAAAPAIAAAVGLGIGRAAAETAALVFTAGAVDRMPSSLADPGRALAVHIYELALSVAGGDASAAASALVLVAALAVIHTLSHLLLPRIRNA